MKIILDKILKEASLVKKDGTIISKYSFRKIINDNLTLEKFETEIENFNKTLALQPEFDDIKDMSKVVQLHTFN